MSRKRTREPDRRQGVIQFAVPELSLPETHPARVLWSVTEKVDLSALLRGAKAVEGGRGRPTTSVHMKLVLWLYAVSRGIGSAREIARLTESDDGFRWIVGNLSIDHSTLSSFRAHQKDALDEVMTSILAALIHKGVLSLDVVAQDGMRVRASASAPSFRKLGSLKQCQQQAALHVKAVFAAADDPEISAAQRARRRAAANDFQRRVDEAIATVEMIQQQALTRSPSARPSTPRASTTDAEARVMKVADGGFRPAYNVQLATAGSPLGGPRTIVGVRVTNVGSDMSSVAPMLDDIEQRTGQLPTYLLADANHADHGSIRDAARRQVTAIIAVPEDVRSSRKPSDDDILAWRARMETDEAKRMYRARAGLCELMNAHVRSLHGLEQFLVRGLIKVTSVALLYAITSNLLQHASALLA